jgi:hypothetical protein
MNTFIVFMDIISRPYFLFKKTFPRLDSVSVLRYKRTLLGTNDSPNIRTGTLFSNKIKDDG